MNFLIYSFANKQNKGEKHMIIVLVKTLNYSYLLPEQEKFLLVVERYVCSFLTSQRNLVFCFKL